MRALLNIFVLDPSPKLAAVYQCDKHVVKMVLESAQLLCSQFDPKYNPPYKRTHYNHPCSVWARISKQNFLWLAAHAMYLSIEYTFRYGRIHAANKAIRWAIDNVDLINLPSTTLTDFALAMPDKYKENSAVNSYRNYYKGDKVVFAKWNRGRQSPAWW